MRTSALRVLPSNDSTLEVDPIVPPLGGRGVEASEASPELVHLAGLGLLAASLTHEVRGPAAALGLLIPELAAAIDTLPGRTREDLTPILHDMTTCAQHLVQLCTQMAAPTRRDTAPELLDLSDVASDAVAIARIHARGLRLRMVESYAPAPVRGVRSQMAQVIINLVLNAIDACRSTEARSHWIEVSVDTVLNTAVIEITDSGPGIMEGETSQAFDRFFTTRPQQAGLGLSIVHQIIKAHHGRIELARDARGGTTVRAILPIAEATAAARTPLAS
jgi:signal transduction histidine kinase